jgi:tRNA threonylcarbamoyladenosine biosynthesis protein TsaB
MLILALDTTTRGGSVALLDDDRVLAEHGGDPSRSHAERLPGDLLALFASAGSAMADVDLFAVASGPGSFTGLRIGIATMQGLALERRRPLIGVSALEALAQLGAAARPSAGRIGVWMDAHRRDVFSALYAAGREPGDRPGRLTELDGAAVGTPASTLARWQQAGTVPELLIGDGAVFYASVAAAAGAEALAMPPLAATIGRLARAQAATGANPHPAAIQPLYVRRPDAEVERERREGQGRVGVAHRAHDVRGSD